MSRGMTHLSMSWYDDAWNDIVSMYMAWRVLPMSWHVMHGMAFESWHGVT